MLVSATNVAPNKHVAVVLCTYNGAGHIDEQVQSLISQQYPVRIHVSDDSSNDSTVQLIEGRLRAGTDFISVRKQNIGYVRNFEQTLSSVLGTDAQYIALSDQDDVWDERRVQSGMKAMEELERKYGSDVPLLVHSDLRLINEDGDLLHDSFLGYRRYRVGNDKCLPIALGENGVMGNTILMNRALAEMCLPFPAALHVHDYWIGLVAELFGHRTLLDTPLVSYRLHTANASNTAHSMRKGIGAFIDNSGVRKLFARDFKLPFKEDSRLRVVEHLLNEKNRFPELTFEQTRELEQFAEFLRFEQSRLRSTNYLLTANVIRKGFLHRMRVCIAALTTRRYKRVGTAK